MTACPRAIAPDDTRFHRGTCPHIEGYDFTMMLTLVILPAVVLIGCATPGSAALPAEAAPAALPVAPGVPSPAVHQHAWNGSDAEVRFVRGMIEHHAQALVMTGLVPARAAREDIRLLAERLEVSQRDEIALLRRWLSNRAEPVGDDSSHGHAATEHAEIPGMLRAEQLARLENATGAEFDRLFLEYMISHHEGALVMIRQLFTTPGAGEDPEVFRFASDVESDQRAEMARMRQILAAISDGGQS
ncbi:MAG TPA: DUF305 domain-containing protein [Gemmatimonadaceae bacterium]|nr:DUF305 domain-containing protein [Gemmatimonadaceae bacterium]